jgi:hypothetical protein
MRDELRLIVEEGRRHPYVDQMQVKDSLKRGNAIVMHGDQGPGEA